MPELPEVEALRLGLLNHLIGRKITDVQVFKPKLVYSNSNKRIECSYKKNEFETELKNQVFKSIKRRAKNLIFEFESGKIMLVHLKMTGQMVYQDANTTTLGGHPIELSENKLPNKHSHIIFDLDEGQLFYNDTRMFGYVLYFPSMQEFEKKDHFKGLGLEPMSDEFTLDYFSTALKKKNKSIKSVFLEQSVVVGLGNIYCDETCFLAKVRPDRLCKSLKDQEIENLYNYSKLVIDSAIKEGGSSVANYLLADGSKGNYAFFHNVYQKSGQPCKICKKPLSKIQHAQRSTVFCDSCQK